MRNSTVFVVDDNDDFRVSVAWMLRGEGHQTVEFACAHKLIQALRVAERSKLRHCCLLLDVRMPGMSGLEIHEVLRTENIPLPVVYMTGHADVELAVEAMKKGAVTFLEKPLETEQLNDAIESAIDASPGGDAIEQASSVDPRLCTEFRSRMKTLTPRELDVLNGIVAGNANKIIAGKLDISVRTVEVHRAHMMKKLHTRSASELVRLVLTCQPRPE